MNRKTVSVEAIIECCSNLSTINNKLNFIITEIYESKSIITKKCKELSDYNNTRVPNSISYITSETSEVTTMKYLVWKITGYSELNNLSENLETIIENIVDLRDDISNFIARSLEAVIKIDGAIAEIEAILGNYSNKKYFKQIVEKYISTSEKLTYPEIYSEEFTPQGITTIDGTYLVTAYKKGENSRIYIYDKKTKKLTSEIILNTNAHVGGISYDKENEIVYVASSDGTVNTYDYKVLKYQIEESEKSPSDIDMIIDLNKSDTSAIIDNNIDISKNDGNNPSSYKTEVGRTSTLYYNDGKLYIGTFKGKGSGQLVEFNISKNNSDNSIDATFNSVSSIPAQTQGIAITEYDGQEYLLTTNSIGITNSEINMYKKNGTNLEHIGSVQMLQTGLEGINVEGNEVIMCYESGVENTTTTTIEDIYTQCSSVLGETVSGQYAESQALSDTGNKIIKDIAGKYYDLTHKGEK